jgi:hypothetical protein
MVGIGRSWEWCEPLYVSKVLWGCASEFREPVLESVWGKNEDATYSSNAMA